MTRRAVRTTGSLLFSTVVLVLAFSPVGVARAATKNWIAGSGNWNTPGNWSSAGVPGAGDDVNIKLTDGIARTITYDYPGPAVTLNSLGINLTGAGAATTTLQMSANNLTTGELDVGWSGFGGSGGRGTFTQSGGVTTVNGPGLYVGVNATDIGTYNLSGTGAVATNTIEVIGSSGTGIFNQTGGSNAITGAGNNLVLGYFAGANGTYTLSGGTLSVGTDLYVGNSGTGTLTIQGTGSASTNGLLINSASAVNLNGGGALSLAGTLDAELINGFSPALGDRFTVLTFASRSGNFGTYQGVNLGGHLSLKPLFNATSLKLRAAPTTDGDVNLDGIVDISDVQRVAANWLTTSPAGDANLDDFVDISDVQTIAANWLQSGSGSGMPGVPEPPTIVLATVGLVALAVPRLRHSRRKG